MANLIVPPAPAVVVTCEHGGNQIPSLYRHLFRGMEQILNSHRAWDCGALPMARQLASALAAPLVASTTTRLLVDLNRSVGHRQLHAPAIRSLPKLQRMEIVRKYHSPYKGEVEAMIERAIARNGRALHLSCHSFTPELDGKARNADLGLLYDPSRPGEAKFCSRWRQAILGLAPTLRVRRNYPYKGTGDGLVTVLRRNYSASRYLGVEIEVNQAIVLGQPAAWTNLRRIVIDSLGALI